MLVLEIRCCFVVTIMFCKLELLWVQIKWVGGHRFGMSS